MVSWHRSVLDKVATGGASTESFLKAEEDVQGIYTARVSNVQILTCDMPEASYMGLEIFNKAGRLICPCKFSSKTTPLVLSSLSHYLSAFLRWRLYIHDCPLDFHVLRDVSEKRKIVVT